MIALRRATNDDVASIKALVHAAYAPWIAVMDREPGPMLADYETAVAQHIIDLHHLDNVLAGLIEMTPKPEHLLIVNVAVAPAFQGRGIGRALMDHAEAVARRHGLDKTWLYTNKLMVANQRLYERMGYRFEREEPFLGGHVVHMSKVLDASAPIAREGI